MDKKTSEQVNLNTHPPKYNLKLDRSDALHGRRDALAESMMALERNQGKIVWSGGSFSIKLTGDDNHILKVTRHEAECYVTGSLGAIVFSGDNTMALARYIYDRVKHYNAAPLGLTLTTNYMLPDERIDSHMDGAIERIRAHVEYLFIMV